MQGSAPTPKGYAENYCHIIEPGVDEVAKNPSKYGGNKRKRNEDGTGF